MRPSPLQNRVDPFGEIHATPERGLFYGNRGGRFHRDDQTLGASRWKSKQWITCLCAFKNRRNVVFGRRYTDLFFLDEPTALAAGHRPCFECRRERALAFRRAVDPTGTMRAGELDRLLDAERRTGRAKREGASYLFYTKDEQKRVDTLLRLTRNTDDCRSVHFDFNHEKLVVEEKQNVDKFNIKCYF